VLVRRKDETAVRFTDGIPHQADCLPRQADCPVRRKDETAVRFTVLGEDERSLSRVLTTAPPSPHRCASRSSGGTSEGSSPSKRRT
jgi:hypothetical protein